jgi:hypothetical protein
MLQTNFGNREQIILKKKKMSDFKWNIGWLDYEWVKL